MCHPSWSVFATAGDDTFMNLFEVEGDSPSTISINIWSSQLVKDMMLVGVCFSGADESTLISIPYDYPHFVVWDNLV